MKHKRNILTAVAACTLLLATPGCQGPSYITEDPNVLLNYQKDPSVETLTDLSKAYLNTINQNRKQGKVQPGLYCDYAVTLYLLGKPEAAEGWFNKEVATFPYTATYVKQLRQEMEDRLNGIDPNRNRRYTVDDINSMDEIAVLRPTENREASELTRESVQESERMSREAVRGLDKPLTKEEERAMKREQRDNVRQEKAAQKNSFTAPGANKEKRRANLQEKAEQKEALEKKQEERATQKAAKKAAREQAKQNDSEKQGLMQRLFGKKEQNTDSSKETKKLEKEAAKAAKAAEKEAKAAAKQQEQAAKAAEKEAKRLAGMSDEEREKEQAKAADKAEQQRLKAEEQAEKAAEKAEQQRLKQESKAAKETEKAEKAAAKKAAKELKEAEKAARKAAKDKDKEFDEKAFDEAFE